MYALREYGFEARVHRDGAGSGACPDSGVIERSGRSTDLLCDLPGDALCGDQKAVLFCGRTSDRMYCRGGGISAVFPRARACPGMAGSALKN